MDQAKRVEFEGTAPILRVEDMARALHFYCELLGFRKAEWGDDDFTSVNRDGAGIYLSCGAQGRGGAWAWVGVNDAAALHEEYVAKGVNIRMPPRNFPWALEIHVEDPDGNVLRFGSEPLDAPYASGFE
jgi:predicted enzyme related to lactoylglutathione lyase